MDLFAEAANGMCEPEEFENAGRFFGWLIKGASLRVPGEPIAGDARQLQ